MLKRFKSDDKEPKEKVSDVQQESVTESGGLADAAGDGRGAAASHSEETAKLQAQIAEKEKEVAELKDKYLRVLADAENSRRRIRQQSEETVRIQRENFLRDLLPIVDNLERALDAASGGGNGKPIVEGVEMVLRSMLDFLKAHGVTQLSVIGQPFDPQRHEAVDQISSAEHPPNTVVSEFHRGYLIGDRMLRPARVAVAKGTETGKKRDSAGGDGGEVENN